MARYWFRQRTFGYGATPNTWQGWLFTLAGVSLCIAAVVFAGRIAATPAQHILYAVTGEAVVLIPFSIVTYLKTEGGWRWRG